MWAWHYAQWRFGAAVHPLQEHLQQVAAIHQQDATDGYGRVELPHASANDPETKCISRARAV
jgi:hypothetical protein